MKVKPILKVADGEVLPVDRPRNLRRALARLAELTRANGAASKLAIAYTTDDQPAEDLQGMLSDVAAPGELLSGADWLGHWHPCGAGGSGGGHAGLAGPAGAGNGDVAEQEPGAGSVESGRNGMIAGRRIPIPASNKPTRAFRPAYPGRVLRNDQPPH